MDIKLRLRSALLGFEDRHVADQSLYAAMQLVRQQRCHASEILLAALAELRICSPAARRLRCRLAAYAMQQAPALPPLDTPLQRFTACICAETTQANVADLAAVARAVVSAAVAAHRADQAMAAQPASLWDTVIMRLSHCATRSAWNLRPRRLLLYSVCTALQHLLV